MHELQECFFNLGRFSIGATVGAVWVSVSAKKEALRLSGEAKNSH